MYGVALLAFNHVLPTLGVVFLITSTIKITKRYPIRRWFF